MPPPGPPVRALAQLTRSHCNFICSPNAANLLCAEAACIIDEAHASRLTSPSMASTLTRLTSQPVHGGSGRAAYSRGSAQGKSQRGDEQEAFFFHFKDSRGSLNSLCQHEKLSSQLQLSQKKPPAAEPSKPEAKPPEAAAACEGAAAKPPEDKMTGEVTESRFACTA